MELREALTQITEIRLQMARTEVFRGYRAVPAAFSGAVALAAATVQAVAIADPRPADQRLPGALDRRGGGQRDVRRARDGGPGAQRQSPR